MPNHLSVLGIIHTAISIFAIIAGLIALFIDGKMDPSKTWGRAYIWLTVITCVTGFPIMKLGHPTNGHYLGILILILLAIGIFVKRFRVFSKLADYVQIIMISTTFFLSFIPATVETLTRLPISHPLADGPNSPIVQITLMVFVGIYIIGVPYQLFQFKKRRKLNEPKVSVS